MTKTERGLVVTLFTVAVLGPQAALADLKLCNRMSYIIESALGVEEKGSVATRGWFRIDPGQCRTVLKGDLTAERIYAHARIPGVYGAAPLPQTGHIDLCVAQTNFVIGGARKCLRAAHRLARFTSVTPSQSEQGTAINFAEEAQYTEEQARDAGIQRLLVVAGYDAMPIDGIRGVKTDAALIEFLQDNKLEPTAAARSNFFDVLLEAAQKPGAVFSWCNDTHHVVMAAIGAEDDGGVVTRGWYRVEPGKCLRPEVLGQPKRLFSYGEAIDADGRVLRRDGKPVSWGGDAPLCVRAVKFELSEQADCAARGLTEARFAIVQTSKRGGATVRFR